MILSRYIFKETIKTQVAVLGILLMIFLSQSFIRILSRAARGALPTQLVTEMLALNIPYMALLMLPLSLFIAILFAHGRLYAESEMTVMRAVGVGPASTMGIAQLLALLTMLVSGVNAMWIAPWAEEQQYQLLDQVKADPGLFALDSGRFMNLDNGKVVAYIDKLEGEGVKELSRIYVLQQGGRLDEALALGAEQCPRLGDYPDLHFVLGNVWLDVAVRNPAQAHTALPNARSCWEQALRIGERPALPHAVAGRGSVAPRHKLSLMSMLDSA